MNYYNEIDLYCAQWLQSLMDAGHIAKGDIDTRSIEDVRPSDLAGYVQCHFFAGLGGWAYALDLAGWPRDRPVWTGSCPCQPFSQAGAGNGFADKRHLWPAWQYHIAQCRPSVIFGEQVASKAVDAWIDLVHADLEGMGYAFGCVPFPSAGVGAPHIRDRTYWVADVLQPGITAANQRRTSSTRNAGRIPGASPDCCGTAGGLADADHERRAGQRVLLRSETYRWNAGHVLEAAGSGEAVRPSPTNGFWRDADWLGCTDGKWRPVEPGTFPLADGIPGRVGRLRAYGNAINAQVAKEFIEAVTGE